MGSLSSSVISDKELREIYGLLSKENLIEALVAKHHELREVMIYSRPTFEQPEEDYKTIDEEIYTYFVCQFGDKVTPLDVIAYEKFGDYCKHHSYTRVFVLNAVRNKGKSQPF